MSDNHVVPDIFPPKVWKFVKIVLGIRSHKDDLPITSTVLHVLTFSSALALFTTNLIYSGYNILTVNARNDILDGIVSIMVVSFFCFLGVYSQNLGFRLYTHPKIAQMMGHPVKWKRKAYIGLSFLLLVAFMLILNVTTLNYTYGTKNQVSVNVTDTDEDDPIFDSIFNGPTANPCQLVNLHLEICQVYWLSQSVFSVFFVFWNVLVVIALLVTSRKVKNDIANLNLMLQDEVYVIKETLRQSFGEENWLTCQDHLWLEEDSKRIALRNVSKKEPIVEYNKDKNLVDIEGSSKKDDSPIRSRSRLYSVTMMSNQELMGRYWEVSIAARLVSLAFQKWMGSLVGMISAWSAIRCAYWFDFAPTWYGIFMFILPLFVIPVLSSAYAEVNYEGGLIPRSIYPVEDRLQIFQYISEQPIVMNVYNHTVSYSTIGTVVAGILAAFGSKILLQEMNYL